MIDPRQLLDHIIRPTLDRMGQRFADPRAAILLLATAAHESECGRWVKQVGGPALGIMQIEPGAHDLVCKWAANHGLAYLLPGPAPHERLVYDLDYSVRVARLLYYSWPDPLPAATATATWPIYKKCYNSELGKATAPQWYAAWNQYVSPIL